MNPAVVITWAYDNNNSECGNLWYLYDWETACDVCPAGWHLPSDAEWTELTDYLGGTTVPVVNLKNRNYALGKSKYRCNQRNRLYSPSGWLPLRRWGIRELLVAAVAGGVLLSTIPITPGTGTCTAIAQCSRNNLIRSWFSVRCLRD